jgi:hypothetical protein
LIASIPDTPLVIENRQELLVVLIVSFFTKMIQRFAALRNGAAKPDTFCYQKLANQNTSAVTMNGAFLMGFAH